MVDPQKLDAFDASLKNLHASHATHVSSNAAAIAAQSDADAKATQSNSDLSGLQTSLDQTNAAGVALGLKVNAPPQAA